AGSSPTADVNYSLLQDRWQVPRSVGLRRARLDTAESLLAAADRYRINEIVIGTTRLDGAVLEAVGAGARFRRGPGMLADDPRVDAQERTFALLGAVDYVAEHALFIGYLPGERIAPGLRLDTCGEEEQ